MRFKILGCALAFLPILACQSETPATPAAEEPTTEPAVAEPAAPEVEKAYVTVLSVLRKAATEDKKIDDPTGKAKKKVSNWVASLYRGEEVTLLAVEGDWAHVRVSDDSEGWLKMGGLLRASDIDKVATVLEQAKVFRRPELLTLDSKKKILPGAVVFSLKEKVPFTRVNFPLSVYNATDGWMLTKNLVDDESEVAVAKLVNKIEHLKKKKDASADELSELVRTQFSGSKLLTLLEEPEAEVVEAPAAAEGAPESDETAPAAAGDEG